MNLYLIWSIEHTAWWRPAWMGYTINANEAGLYGEEDADKILKQANRFTVNEAKVPVECVFDEEVLQKLQKGAPTTTICNCYPWNGVHAIDCPQRVKS